MKTILSSSRTVGNTIMRLAFLGGLVLGVVYLFLMICATAFKVL